MSPTVAFPTREMLHLKLNGPSSLGSPLASMFIVSGRGGATHFQKQCMDLPVTFRVIVFLKDK